jgi:hypothetical protein
MRRVTLIAVAVWLGSLLPAAAQQTAGQQPAVQPTSGTLVRLVPPQSVVIKTADGMEQTIVVQPTWMVRVFAPVEVDALPDGTPCRLYNATMKPATGAIVINHLRVETPQTRVSPRGGAVRLLASGDLDFVEGVPGLLKKIVPLSFQVGAARYTVADGQGVFNPAPPQQQNSLLNRVFPLTHPQQNGQITAEYDFGSDWRMAGVDAQISLITPPGVQPQVLVKRVEPLPKTTAPSKKK